MALIMRDAEQRQELRANGSNAEVTPENIGLGHPRAEQAEILHGLNNVLVSILLNAQLIEWKLPSYSRLRRNVHEIERSAQRAGALLKRLRAEAGAKDDQKKWVVDEVAD